MRRVKIAATVSGEAGRVKGELNKVGAVFARRLRCASHLYPVGRQGEEEGHIHPLCQRITTVDLARRRCANDEEKPLLIFCRSPCKTNHVI